MKHQFSPPPEIRKIIGILQTAPFEIRLVGGAVRDSLLERKITDFDFAAATIFADLENFLKQSPCKIVRINPRHGSILCTNNGLSFDITILRQDIDTDGRHARISATESWFLDAQRRDFTINALYADINDGTIYDPLNTGLKDIQDSVLCFIGDAKTRIKEDYLRILRFFRFQNQLNFTYNTDTLPVIASEISGLNKLSQERIGQETQKILAKPKIHILHQMQSCGVFKQLFDINPSENFNIIERMKGKNPDWIINLAALFINEQNAMTKLENAVTLSKIEKKRCLNLCTTPIIPASESVWLYLYGRKLASDYWWLYGQDHMNINDIKTIPIPLLPVNAQDLIKLGYQGADISNKLRLIEQNWIKSDLKASCQDLLKLL